MTIRIRLAWPDKILSPNARPHFHALASAKKAAREAAFWATRSAMGVAKIKPGQFPHDGASDILLRQVAHPPDRRDRDRDNIDASLKAARDGIAEAMAINDRFFRPTGIEWGEPDPNHTGFIIIEIEGGI